MPTALFAFNDRLATGAVNASFCKAGFTVPGDISVIGYDNLGYYNIISPGSPLWRHILNPFRVHSHCIDMAT